MTSVLAAISFGLLVIGLWGDIERDRYWEAWGACALMTLCGSHAALVLRSLRPDDTPLIRTLIWTSIVTATIDTLAGVLGLLEVVDAGDAAIRVLAVLLVIMLLSTVLPPIMRRLNRSPAPNDAFGHRLTTHELADEIASAATRIERVATPTDAHREAAALRRLADRARG